MDQEAKHIENITVSVRIRPLNQRELTSGGESIWLIDSGNSIKEKSGPRVFTYDQVYNESTETTEIFMHQGLQVIEKCLAGFNGCIFCYGQTGSGKTHTMHGIRKTNPGLVPLSIDQIFSTIQKSQGKEFLIRCSYIEIYNESVNDLLNPNLLNLQLAEDKKSGIKIVGVTEEVCTSANQVNSLLVMGEKHKNVASTNFNQRSSRAHSIVIVESKNSKGKADVAIAALNLIDLAGSESADVHGPAASNSRSKEMKYINRSLLTLSTVIMRLSAKKNNIPIPYRDSKLTRLLQPALEGDSKVSIICNISSCSDAYDETLSTLMFAQRAKKIKQTIVKNDVTDSKALIVKYEREINELQERLREMENKMTQEENKAMNIVVTKEIMMLQEEKEKADAKLDSILQEKLQLQQDLERLKSFIICAEDVKPPKMLLTESEEKVKFERGFLHSKTYHSNAGNKEPNIINSPNFKGREIESESLLIKDIDKIESEFDDDILNRISVIGLSPVNDALSPKNGQNRGFNIGGAPKGLQNNVTYPASIEECMKIINEQAAIIEEFRIISNKEQLLAIIKEQDDRINEMRKIIGEKDEEIELAKDELKLCRNNLTKLQVAYKLKKFK